MSRDASGTYSRVVTPPANGDVANATDFNSEINDIALEITASLETSGKKTWTGTQNANGYGVKTLANTKVHTLAGGTTAYTLTTGATFTALSQIPLIAVKPNATNTGSSTLNIDSIGATTIKLAGANLSSGQFVQDKVYLLAYDGTNFNIIAADTAYLGLQTLDATTTAIAALSWSSLTPLLQFTAADTVSLTSAPKVTTIELGDATDTTLSRSAAGVAAVEGVDLVGTSLTQTLTNKTLTSPTVNGGTNSSRIQLSSETTGTLTSASANKKILATGGITLPNSVFTAEDIVIIEGNGTARTITRGAGVTMYIAGTDSATGTLTANGVMGVTWRTASICILTGNIS